jgi:drug/metabolite transporter (DMT)-like permease
LKASSNHLNPLKDDAMSLIRDAQIETGEVAGPRNSPLAAKGRRTIPIISWQGRLVLLATIWGSSFLFIKVGDESLAPLQVTLARLAFGAAALLAILAVRRERLPRGRQVWLRLAVAALLVNVIPFSLFAYGETHTTSVLAGIWNATTPLFTLIVAMAALPEERPTLTRAAGLATGFVGVLIVLGVWHGVGGNALIGNLACLAAALSYGFGFPYTRKYLSGRPESSVALAAGQLLCGTVVLAVIVPFVTSMPSTLPLHVTVSMLALGVLGTGIGYILNFEIIRDAGATPASTVTYIVPLFATVEGMLFLGEPLTWYEPVGAVVVILGVAVSQGRLRIKRRAPRPDR